LTYIKVASKHLPYLSSAIEMRGFVVAKSLRIRQLGFNMQANIQRAVELSGTAAATALLLLVAYELSVWNL
jgi:hypothetical protein